MERVVDVVATRERIKAGVEVLATSCRPLDLSAAFNQFRYDVFFMSHGVYCTRARSFTAESVQIVMHNELLAGSTRTLN